MPPVTSSRQLPPIVEPPSTWSGAQSRIIFVERRRPRLSLMVALVGLGLDAVFQRVPTPARCGSVRAKPNFTPEVMSIKLFGPGVAAATTPNATKPARTSRCTCKAEAPRQFGRGGEAHGRFPSAPSGSARGFASVRLSAHAPNELEAPRLVHGLKRKERSSLSKSREPDQPVSVFCGRALLRALKQASAKRKNPRLSRSPWLLTKYHRMVSSVSLSNIEWNVR